MLNTTSPNSHVKFFLLMVLAPLWLAGCSSMSLPFAQKDSQTEAIPDDTSRTTSGALTNKEPNKGPDEIPNESPDEKPLIESVDKATALKLRQSPNRYLSTRGVLSKNQDLAFQHAVAQFHHGNLVEATTLLQPLLHSPDAPSFLYVLMGDIAMRANDKQAAVANYENALKQNQYNYFALNRMGMQARENGHFENAEAYYLSALEAWPGNEAAYYNLGILYDLYVGDKAKALSQYETYFALVSNPKSGDVDKKQARQIQRWIADLGRQLVSANKENHND
ncbi:hypothetical protein Q4561_00720 [Alteromonas sp. 1_MG-2023]|uniref:hypothetical protein n=1 Tax=Alteromonas sp. 1_MG-2023 TaxID=3062669 RepID=UPI0026E1F594|nr:hypothetical protein [Alteromonas sp. 1_MG-2023]MDO6565568.1 hypothetical protein [Alteromonas sp. 1_MG-2023]